MAAHRINVANNKRSNQVKHAKREIATLLGEHKDEKARIKVEHIIREDFMIESYELLGLMCELLHERIPQITMSKDCPQEMLPAVTSIIWACDYVDFPELREIASQLTKKFGDKFAKAAKANEGNTINERLYSKLVYKPPSKQLVIAYLEEIARAYDVEWDAKSAGFDESDDEDDKGNGNSTGGSGGAGGGGNKAEQPFSTPTGYSIPMAPGSGLAQAYAPAHQYQQQQPPQPQHLAMSEAERLEHEAFLRNQVPSYALPPAPLPPSLPPQQPVIASPIYDPPIEPIAKAAPAVPPPNNVEQVDDDDFQDEDDVNQCAGAPPVPPPSSNPDVLPEADDFLARLEALKR